MKKSSTPFILALLLLGGVVAGVAWFLQNPAPLPAPVAAIAPKPMPAPPVVALPPPPPPPLPEEPAPAPVDTAAAQTPAERLASAVTLLTSPNWTEANAQEAKDLIDTTYAPLAGQLGLNQADADAFSNLLVQRLASDRTALAVAASQGLNLTDNPGAVAQLVRAADAPVETQINQLLGPAGYVQYQIYAAPIRLAVAAALRQNQQ